MDHPATIVIQRHVVRRLVVAVALIAWTAVLTGCASRATPPTSTPGSTAGAAQPAPAPTGTATSPPSPTARPSPSPTPPPSATPDAAAAPSRTVVPLRIERRTRDAATADFVATAEAILTDRRGWIRAGFGFTVEPDAAFLLVLAEGDEVDELCLPYDTSGRFSCQNGPVVALNADRWREATPEWPGTLADYRTYLVNHEVGHLLHLHHPSPQCPGPGLPAPVMLQQSTGLGDCTANPWPLPWEVDLAAARREPLAPPADHDVDDHRPTPPRQQQDLEDVAG